MTEFQKIWNETMGCGACEQEQEKDCDFKHELYKAIDELKTICGTGTVEKAVTENNINWLKWKIDKLLSDALKEAYMKGYDYGVKDWFKAKTEPCEDCISRQAVVDAFWKLDTELRPSAIDAILNMVKELPSVTPKQPFINKPCISEGVCHEDKVKVLKKIRAEIIELRSRQNVGVLECLDIIEKYIAEDAE